MKKILLLGGSRQQIPSIAAARKLGYYVITCDYLPGNPGHIYADEYHNVSTTDKASVLALAERLRIDGIACYASDPSAVTAAYVAEQMCLPSNPYKSVEILSNKEKFRSFLKENGFCVPKAKGYPSFEEARAEFGYFNPPVIIKPVDSSGSKGVALVHDACELEDKINGALSYSRAKRVMLEEFIERDGYQIAGDGFSVNGRLAFRCFGNDHFDRLNINPFVPVAASFPCAMPDETQGKIHAEIDRLLSLLKMGTGAYNFDVITDKSGNVYLLDIGARNGGCYIPQLIKYASGVDLAEYTIMAAMGEDCSGLEQTEPSGFWSYCSVCSRVAGILKGIEIGSAAAGNIVEYHGNYKTGEKVPSYMDSGGTIGILLMKFDSMDKMLDMMDRRDSWLKVPVEPE